MPVPLVPPTIPWKDTYASSFQAGDGTVITSYASYGNFVFPSVISLKMTVEPVYDTSNRQPKWWKHTFTFETIIDPVMNPTADSTGLHPVDQNFSQFRRILQTPGLTLKIFAKGIGQNQRPDNVGSPSGISPTGVAAPLGAPYIKQDPMVSGGGEIFPLIDDAMTFIVRNNNDLNFGPRPTLIVAEPIGASRVWRIVWNVEVALPTCCIGYSTSTGTICLTPTHLNSPAIDNNKNLLVTEFNYSMAWSIDDERFTVRTIVGDIEVQGWFGPFTTPGLEADNPDNSNTSMAMNQREMAERIQRSFFVPPGFVRDFQYDLSRDKRKMAFRLTDTEIRSDNPYFAGILKCNASQEISGPPLGAKFDLNFSGSFTVQAGVPKVAGYMAFLMLMQARLRFAVLGVSTVRTVVGTNTTYNYVPSYRPKMARWREDIFSRTVSFAFLFQFNCSLHQLLFSTGMFSRLPGSWQGWSSGLSPSTLNPLGSAELTAEQKTESMSGICNNQRLADDISLVRKLQYNNEQYIFNTVDCPTPEKSWVDYNITFTVEAQSKVAPIVPAKYLPLKYLQDKRLSILSPEALLGLIRKEDSVVSSVANSAEVTQSSRYNTSTDDQHTRYQIQGPSRYLIHVRGYAIRYCYSVPAPALAFVYTQLDGTRGPEVPQLLAGKTGGPVRIGEISPVPLNGWWWWATYSVVGQPMGDAWVELVTDGVPEIFQIQLDLRNVAPDTTNNSPSPQNYSPGAP